MYKSGAAKGYLPVQYLERVPKTLVFGIPGRPGLLHPACAFLCERYFPHEGLRVLNKDGETVADERIPVDGWY